MKKVLSLIWKHFDDALTVFFFLGLFFVVLFQLLLRVVLNTGFVWTEELSRLFLMYACFASLPRVLKKREELKLTLLTDRLSPKHKHIFDIIVLVISIIAFAYLTYLGIRTMDFQATNIMPAMRFSMKWMYIAFPISMIGGIIRAVECICQDIRAIKEEV